MKRNLLFFVLLLFFVHVKSQSNKPPELIWSHCYGEGSSNEWAEGACLKYDGSVLSVGMGGGFVIDKNGNEIVGHIGYGVLTSACKLSDNKIVMTGAVGGSSSYMSFQLADSNANPVANVQFVDFMANKTIQTRDGNLMMVGTNGYFGNKFMVMKASIQGAVKWKKVYNAFSRLTDVCENADGSFIIIGNTTSITGIAQTNHGRSDFFVAKIDSIGNLIWSKCYGGKSDEYVGSILSNGDNTYNILGSTASFDGDVVGHHGVNTGSLTSNNSDVWLIKIDSSGRLLSQKCFGTSNNDGGGTSMVPTKDKGLVILCSSVSLNDGDLNGMNLDASKRYAWVFRIDSNMNIYWNKCVGGISRGDGSTLIRDLDSNYIVCGMAASNGEDVYDWHVGNLGASTNADMWVFKLAKDTVYPIILQFAIQNFEARKKGKNVELKWECAENVDPLYFNILKSEDGVHFLQIGQEKSNATNTYYTFIDDNAKGDGQHPILYYKIEKVSKDLSKRYSEIKKVDVGKSLDISLYPNPTHGIVNIEGKDIRQIKIKGMDGKTLSIFNNLSGNKLDLSSYKKGCYIVQFIAGNVVIAKKLIID